MLLYLLIIVASFHGEIKYKTVIVDSKEVCEAAKPDAIKMTAKDNPEMFSVQCIPIQIDQHT